jgi:hypothetical protein
MSDSEEMLNEMEFEKRIKVKPDRELMEFVAREVYKVSIGQNKICGDIYGNGKEGLCLKVNRTEKTGKDNRSLIIAMWIVDASIIGTLIAMFVTHMGG